VKSKNILVIGSLNADLVVSVPIMPVIGETVSGDDISYAQGGKGANQAYAAAFAGGYVTMLGCVGQDGFGKAQKENLSSVGADVSKIKTSNTSPTGTAVICVDNIGRNSIIGTCSVVTKNIPDNEIWAGNPAKFIRNLND
jgi:ribokinase